ncbi:N-acetylmuramoyl-L-alanine amidase [Paenibacillus sacheonensis]|uniref:SH3 domain-containing protein n=1 Tax=Paenibacillus sacheonensis TaxID=742054 RepID=A0A7X5BZR9_9BACL|nr:N-acetylmuramoyl-L-alanine amidase [Paenibacillus sacheonensis]MBM7568342.1 N-acetylmuramoyl-L-alanine amidase [Paenibacillus sacheonensis]NBC68475.1 SH3 domain-containing protein [Paenibacillus sacheonensis]
MRTKWIGCLALIFIVIVGGFGLRAHDASAVTKLPYQAKVTTTALNVRSEPSLQASVVGQLRSGAVVTVTEEDDDGWVQIKGSKISGYAAGYLLHRTDSSGQTAGSSSSSVGGKASSSPGSTATVTADSLRIRSGPGTGYSVIGSLKQGEQVSVAGSQSDWLKIRTSGGSTGWVAKEYVGQGAPRQTEQTHSSGNGIKGKLIVVDAGHGGSDPGMIGTTYETQEKELTLSTAQYVKQELTRLGAKVIMTRTTDVKPELSERVHISETNRADAFVSIHYNSSEKKTSGTLTFFYSEKKDKPLAYAIEAQLDKSGIGLRSNGLSFGDLYVLRENSTVAALVELGFLSNAKDESIVRGSGYQRNAAAAIARGLANYFD